MSIQDLIAGYVEYTNTKALSTNHIEVAAGTTETTISMASVVSTTSSTATRPAQILAFPAS